jgi:hypothetical protein
LFWLPGPRALTGGPEERRERLARQTERQIEREMRRDGWEDGRDRDGEAEEIELMGKRCEKKFKGSMCLLSTCQV